LKNFQNSPAGDEFLHGLPKNDIQTSLLSGTLLQSLSLSDANNTLLSSASSRFLSFRWSGSRFENNLEGRITLTTLVIPNTGVPSPESSLNALHTDLGFSLPRDYDDLQCPRWRMRFWTSMAWVDTKDTWMDSYLGHPGQQVTTAENKSDLAVLCEFRR
jgi:hypothetical protein